MSLRPRYAGIILLLGSGCGHQSSAPVRMAVLPFENLTADPRIDWMANASAAALVSDLTGLRQIYPFRADSIRTAYATRAGQVIQPNFEFNGDRVGLHASLEELPRRRIVRQFSLEGPLRDGMVPLINRLAKQIDAGARAFSTRDPAAFGSFGQALASSDAAAQARLLQTATIQDPNFTAAYTDLGQTLLMLGNRAEAGKVAAAGAQHAPNPIDRASLAYLSALAHDDLGAREKALAALAQLTPADPDVFRSLAQIHLLEHKYVEAVRDYQAVARLDPGDPAILNVLGYTQAYAHDLAGARQSLTTYRKLSAKGDTNAVDSLGEVHFFLGDFPAAERYFLEAQQLNPGAGDIEMLKAAQAHLMTGDRNGADQIFARYMGEYRKGQDPVQNDYQRALWEFLTGRRKQALGRLQALLPSAGGDTAALLEAQLSVWYLQTGNRPEAARLAWDAGTKAATPRGQSLSALCRFLSSVSFTPSNNNFADALALLLAGQFAEAIPPLDNLYRNMPPEANGQVRTLLAWAYTSTGRTRDAAGLVDLYPIPLSSGERLFASLTFPKFLKVRSMVLDAHGKRDEAQKLMALYRQYAGDLPDQIAPLPSR